MRKILMPSKKLQKFQYQCRNYAAFLRGIRQQLGTGIAGHFGAVTLLGELSAEIIRSDGSSLDLGVIGRRVVTDAGVAFLVDDWDGGGSDFSLFNFHDSGTGVGAEDVTDTALGTAGGPSRVAGTKSQPSANQARSLAVIPYTATLAITEHGIFSASTTGTLWDRTVFSAINVVTGDSIQFTYTLTITAGG